MPKTQKQVGLEKRPRDREATRTLLIEAVGKMLADQGFTKLGVNAVAKAAGVDKVLIYRYFGGMPGLISAFGQEGDFWPSIEELAGGDIESFRRQPLEDKLYALGRNFLAGIRRRPLTQEIMAWEMVERNDLTVELETIRETRMLRFAEMFLPDAGAGIDLMAISAIIGAGITYLVCRSRKVRWYNGIDLGDDEGWKRIEQGIGQVIKGAMKLL
ncbi:MAG: TetR/AcrR family transcriptional regulator [Desulfobacteraceae bacterium]|nr:MAG: TetR/AcrR family transcriptional regulator [Desulfobacteraceae bacterium]